MSETFPNPDQTEPAGPAPEAPDAAAAPPVAGIKPPTADLLVVRDISDDYVYRPQPPLTEKQIERIEDHRGKSMSLEQIKGIDDARALGKHTGIV